MKRWGYLILLCLCLPTVQASIVEPGVTYVLSDHPDALLTDMGAGITYGLRLDSLGGTNANKTFSTTQDGAFATLFWNDMTNTVEISGTLSHNSDNTLWNISYTLSNITQVLGTNGGFEALLSNGSVGSGTLTNGTMTIEYGLAGKADNDVLFTTLGDGHRCEGEPCTSDLIGRGWLKVFETDHYGTKEITYGSNDWLVQLTPVPVPAALPLFLTGLFGFSFFSRRKS